MFENGEAFKDYIIPKTFLSCVCEIKAFSVTILNSNNWDIATIGI